MVYMINSVELTGYNGERSVRQLTHLQEKLRSVCFCPNANTAECIRYQDEWLRRFNDLEKRLHQSSSKLDILFGFVKDVQWVKVKFNYTSYYG